MLRGDRDLAMSGIQYKMQQRIVSKLRRAGAISIEKAVTIQEASLDISEESWVHYFIGDYLGRIRRNGNDRYYTEEL
jgi:predicted transcriptional regulator YheO